MTAMLMMAALAAVCVWDAGQAKPAKAAAVKPARPASILRAIRAADNILARSPDDDPTALWETISEAKIFAGEFAIVLNLETIERVAVRDAGESKQILYAVKGYVAAYDRPAGRYKTSEELELIARYRRSLLSAMEHSSNETEEARRLKWKRELEESLRTVSGVQGKAAKERKASSERVPVVVSVSSDAKWFDVAAAAKRRKLRFVVGSVTFELKSEGFGPLRQRVGRLEVTALRAK